MNLCTQDPELQKLIIAEQDWENLSAIKTLLETFHDTTLVVSNAKKPNGSKIIPTSDWLISSVASFSRKASGPFKVAAQATLA